MAATTDDDERPSVQNRMWILCAGLLIGTFSLFVATSFRDFAEAFLRMSAPLSDKTVSGGALLVAHRFFSFLIILAIFFAISFLIVT